MLGNLWGSVQVISETWDSFHFQNQKGGQLSVFTGYLTRNLSLMFIIYPDCGNGDQTVTLTNESLLFVVVHWYRHELVPENVCIDIWEPT